MKINILGHDWEIVERTEADDPRLEGCYGFTDWTTREIVIDREIEGTLGDMGAFKRKIKRHEITHAFLMECGLGEHSGECDSWAENETMVDWIARLGPRLFAAWAEADALFAPITKN